MKPQALTDAEKVKAFDKIAKLCVAEMKAVEEIFAENPSGLQTRGSGMKDIQQKVFEEAMEQTFGGRQVWDHYNKHFD